MRELARPVRTNVETKRRGIREIDGRQKVFSSGLWLRCDRPRRLKLPRRRFPDGWRRGWRWVLQDEGFKREYVCRLTNDSDGSDVVVMLLVVEKNVA